MTIVSDAVRELLEQEHERVAQQLSLKRVELHATELVVLNIKDEINRLNRLVSDIEAEMGEGEHVRIDPAGKK
jgi:hypothetical protein